MIDTRLEYAKRRRSGHSAETPELPAARHPGHGDRYLRHIAIAVSLLLAALIVSCAAHTKSVSIRPTSSSSDASQSQILSAPAPPITSASLNATVHWVAESHVYLWTPEPLRVNDRVLFTLDGKEIASGIVTISHENDVTMVSLASGRIGGEHPLDRIRVVPSRMSVRLPSTLRVGGPSSNRSNLLFRGPRIAVRSLFSDSSYRVDSISAHLFREVRAIGYSNPETVVVKLFDESVDEEIGMERGELDVAVFWPGELSTEMRRHSNWELIHEERAYVVATPFGREWPTHPAPDWFAALDRDMFRGDLGRWTSTMSASATAAPSGLRVDFDPSCPGKQRLDRFFSRGAVRGRADDSTIRLFCVQPPDVVSQVARYLQRNTMPAPVRQRGDTFAHTISSWNFFDNRPPRIESALVGRVFAVNDCVLVDSTVATPFPYLSHAIAGLFDYRVVPEVPTLLFDPTLRDSSVGEPTHR